MFLIKLHLVSNDGYKDNEKEMKMQINGCFFGILLT